jgi:hypothetical protein
MQDPIQKIMAAKKAGGMAQEAEHLSNKRKALSSNPSTAKKKTIKNLLNTAMV